MESPNINITIIDRDDQPHAWEVPSDIGISLMELCKANDLDILATCGGMALCATCHVYIESDNELSPPSYDEEMMLDQLPLLLDNSRLACQLRVDNTLDGLVARLAPE